jgi:FtsP/CotA-like multicopper oxidase with cupredoxin domain
MRKRELYIVLCLLLGLALLFGASPVYAQDTTGDGAQSPQEQVKVTQADREAAAERATQSGLDVETAMNGEAMLTPGEIPHYFGPYPNYATSPLPVIDTALPTPTYYFAEGTARTGFDTYICIQNPGGTDAEVTITYMKGDGTTDTYMLVVAANSRTTVMPKATIGTGDDNAHDFSAKVECTNGQQIVAERPMYFNYLGMWTGGHDVVGATSPAAAFYFAEGTARPNFEPYFCIQNPGDKDAEVLITYMKGDGTTADQTVIVPASSRYTVPVKDFLGEADDDAHDFSAKVECVNNQQIVAERPMYFNYLGMWTGGHDVVGTTDPAHTFFFAEGTTRTNFDPYLCIQNPGDIDAEVEITYMPGDGTTTTVPLTVPMHSRATVRPRDKLGTGDDNAHDFSTRVECINGQYIVAERPMYFNYLGEWSGGHDVIGTTTGVSTAYFAEGTARPNFDPYICIQNPGLVAAEVTITYMKGNAFTAKESLIVPAGTRFTVNPKSTLGSADNSAHDFSARVECTNGQYIVAERPMYFDYGEGWTGGHDVIGFSFDTSIRVVEGTGMRKFVDSLPGLGIYGSNNLGQYVPVAIPDKSTYPGSDYYEIELGEYTQQLHSDLPPTTLRGYRQTNTTDASVSVFTYSGPLIVSQRDRPVRIKFTNNLPTGEGGDLFIPVDTTVMGAGMGPDGMTMYTQNRASVHLHGGYTPWISDGTPHQWITPAGESTPWPKGVSVQYVPDMWYDASGNPVPAGTPGATNDPGDGSMTFYYTNQQSARLMFYHDHAYGITRLNVYAGEASLYLIEDPVEKELVKQGIIPRTQLPLLVQDKTFVPDDAQLAWQDPTWDKAKWGGMGNLWMPHVYMPNQNPADLSGINAFGRWSYGPWFWPPPKDIVHGPVPNPYYDPVNRPWENSEIPGTPTPSMAMEAFMDTPMVNGTAYPYTEVQPKSYRLRILNAANDRFFNLQFYVADPDVTTPDGRTKTEVRMVPAVATPGYPEGWPTDGREGGVPDPATAGPEMIQIGTEGGFLPAPVVLPNLPIDWNTDPTTFTAGNVDQGTLILGPAERGDVIVDFSQYAGKTLILYNDAPAAFPARDPRYDYFTGAPDLTDTGGAPTPLPGYGPNIRTVMQIKVADTKPAPAFDLARLEAAFASTATQQGVFEKTQDPIIVPSADYDSAYNKSFPVDPYVRIYDTAMTIFNGPLPGLMLTNGGSGYTSAPAVTISGGTGNGATATAQISGVTGVTLTNGGTGYTHTPTVGFTGGGGSGAAADAQISGVTDVTVTNGGAGYSNPPTVTFTGGGGSGAAATAQISGVTAVNITDGGTGYLTTAPNVAFEGGGGSGATATATIDGSGAVTGVTITNGGSGYISPPMVVFSGGDGTGVMADAVVMPGAVTGIIITNGGSGYNAAPDVSLTGGGGLGATATATVQPGVVTGIILTNGGSDYTSAPTVGITGGDGAGATADATIGLNAVTGLILTNQGDGYTYAPTVSIEGGGGTGATAVATGVTIPFTPKAIQDEQGEAYDPEYGRMSGFLGLELSNFAGVNRGFVLYPFATPPVDIIMENVTPSVPQVGDNTQIWKITHNGVDTHTLHFHLFNVQLINRVAWDNIVMPPDPNELGWKETIRVSPLEDTIVAIRAVAPDLPFELPDSVRLIDPTMPEHATLVDVPGGYFDPLANPVTITNEFVNFGWEYVLHCHLLGHEEMDMMHPMPFVVAPLAPSDLTAATGMTGVDLNWTDNSIAETSFVIEIADDANGPWTEFAEVAADITTYTDTSTFSGTRYYRVFARNTVGSMVPNFPVGVADSAPTNTVSFP